VSQHLAWYIARSCGIVSWVLLSASVLWGVVLSTRLLGRRVAPAWLLDLHRFLGAAATVFVGIHVGGLVMDTYVHFGLAEVLVPFASRWHPVAVSYGVVGLYLLVAVEGTSLLKRHLPIRVWRRVHVTSFGLWFLATLHGLTAGTDAGNVAFQWGAVVVFAAIVFAGTVRLLSPRPERPPRPLVTAARGGDERGSLPTRRSPRR
jgi:predicted ferric reductase